MRFAYAIIASGLLIGGCARFTTVQTDVSVDQDGSSRTITTRATAYTLFASRSALANWKASQTDKTQGASVGTLTQESQAASNIVEAVISAAIRAAAGK